MADTMRSGRIARKSVEVRILSAASPEHPVHSRETVAEALRLISDRGLNHCEVSRRLGVARPTIRDWASGKLPHSFAPKESLYGRSCRGGICAVCGGDEHDFQRLSSAYVYLLGLYLGDGTISHAHRGVFKLRVFLDMRYPGIVAECQAAMAAVFPYNSVNKLLTASNCYEVYSFSKSWPCLFPQHGPGKKHLRPIVLTAWQQDFVELIPHLLLRGLIHSDGCRSINTGRGGWTCPRYSFSNRSQDIHRIFRDTCDLLDLHWTRAGTDRTYVSRKADVATLDRYVGPKR
jgi:hypothetical protein